MSSLFHILRFEWKNLGRSQLLKLLLFVFLGAGIYGIFFGKFEIDKQETRMAGVRAYEQAQFDSLMTWMRLDTSIAANKAKYQKAANPLARRHFTYYVTHDTPPLAGLCLGQRDLFPVYYGINVRDLARQLSVGELANPMKLLTGNFDLSYVFLFLLPLLLIALFYNLYAAEKEVGTLSLLQSQSTSLNTILFGKGLLRLLIIWGLSTLLLILGFVIQGISILENTTLFFQWLLTIFGYTLFWTLLMTGIIALKRGSTLSAMLGLGVWLIFTLISPALLNLTAAVQTPLPNRAEATHSIRALNGKIFSSPRSFVLDDFYAENPQFTPKDTVDFNKWYYASFTLLDKEINALNAQFEAQVDRRNALLEKWQWLAPAAAVHEKLSAISETDRNSHQRFVEEVHAYHQHLKKVYYSKIYGDALFSLEDLASLNKNLSQ